MLLDPGGRLLFIAAVDSERLVGSPGPLTTPRLQNVEAVAGVASSLKKDAVTFFASFWIFGKKVSGPNFYLATPAPLKGCQIFLGTIYQSVEKIYQMTTYNITKCR
jgi:hypothetical protein